MVSVERIRLAETEEELKQLQAEKDALQRALHLIEGENTILRKSRVRTKSLSTSDLRILEQHHGHFKPNQGSVEHDIQSSKVSRMRSSSEVAIKSRPNSVILPSFFAPESESFHAGNNDGTVLPLPSPVRPIV